MMLPPQPPVTNETVTVAHGERRRAEEIAALDPLAFEGQFVIAARRLAGPGNAGHLAAALHDDRAVADNHLSLPAEIGHLPAFQRLAVEELFNRRRRFSRFISPLGGQHRPKTGQNQGQSGDSQGMAYHGENSF